MCIYRKKLVSTGIRGEPFIASRPAPTIYPWMILAFLICMMDRFYAIPFRLLFNRPVFPHKRLILSSLFSSSDIPYALPHIFQCFSYAFRIKLFPLRGFFVGFF